MKEYLIVGFDPSELEIDHSHVKGLHFWDIKTARSAEFIPLTVTHIYCAFFVPSEILSAISGMAGYMKPSPQIVQGDNKQDIESRINLFSRNHANETASAKIQSSNGSLRDNYSAVSLTGLIEEGSSSAESITTNDEVEGEFKTIMSFVEASIKKLDIDLTKRVPGTVTDAIHAAAKRNGFPKANRGTITSAISEIRYKSGYRLGGRETLKKDCLTAVTQLEESVPDDEMSLLSRVKDASQVVDDLLGRLEEQIFNNGMIVLTDPRLAYLLRNVGRKVLTLAHKFD